MVGLAEYKEGYTYGQNVDVYIKKIQYDSYGGKQGAWLECEFFIEMEASDILGLQSTDVSPEGSINRKQL